MARRKDILHAVYEAERLHKEFDSRARAEAGEGRIDVFAMLVERDIPVMFQPLKNLLGAFVDTPDEGIMVTSQRPLPVQRFTAAHELGHKTLGHEASFDEEEVLTRALFAGEGFYDRREIQANAFATQLLTPSWLLAQHMRAQGWTRDNLTDPVVVYQLSLRMGSSYTATCYAIEQAKGIDARTRERLLKVKPKAIKQRLVSPYERETWYGDVWLVTDRDDGMLLEGGRSDLVVLQVEEHPSSGYRWQFGDLTEAGFTITADVRASRASKEHVGGKVMRTVMAEPGVGEGATGHVHLRETRPWQPEGEPLSSLKLDIDLSGPVRTGLLPAQRDILLSVA